MPRSDPLRLATSIALFMFALGSSSVAGDRLAEWGRGQGQGYVEYGAVQGSSSISISCDVAASNDRSRTSINLEIDGKLLPANSTVRFVVDDQEIKIPSDKSGGISTASCAECALKFRQLWALIRKGRSLEVIASNAARVKFSLKGVNRVLPEKPCETGPAAG